MEIYKRGLNDKVTEYPRQYEHICDGGYRIKVPRGWIFTDYGANSQSSVFIPDPNHAWKLEPFEKDE